MMPDISGLELIDILKADLRLSSIPILLCTANNYLSEHEIEKATDICYKPFEIDDLLGKVSQMLSCCKNNIGKMLIIEDVDDEDPLHFESKQLMKAANCDRQTIQILEENGYQVVSKKTEFSAISNRKHLTSIYTACCVKKSR